MPGRLECRIILIPHRSLVIFPPAFPWKDTIMSRNLVALAALAVLSACAPDLPPNLSTDASRSWEHRCPAAGTVVRTSNNLSIRYAGGAAPGVCRLGDGRAMHYGMWAVPVGQQSPEIGAWLAGLFPAVVGKSATRGSVGRPVGMADGTSFMWAYEARVLGFETLALPFGRRDAVLIEWDSRGTGNNNHHSRQRRWLDVETGAVIRSEARAITGTIAEHAWQASALSVPAPTRP